MSKSNKPAAAVHSQAYTSYKDAAELDAAIQAVCVASVSLQQQVQDVAIGILLHTYHSGDWRKANDLVLGLGDGVRKEALVDWFVKFGGLEASEKDGKFIDFKGVEYIKANIDAAKAKAWWTFRKLNPFAGFDLDAALAQVLKKHEQAVKKAADLANKGDASATGLVKADAAKLKALQALVNGSVTAPVVEAVALSTAPATSSALAA